MKRNLFAELKQGVTALEDQRKGKLTLRTIDMEIPSPVEVSAEEIREMRTKMNVSRAVLAHRLRVNPRTLENWEQGTAKPNAQAAVLIKLVKQHPETFDYLAAL
ncbi:DNA-binding transcriptional regulator [Burkholderia sp. S171]|uniref:helix-turn-helix domain-containing protein n=1 Tax=Burkholderia sp. S171 TaxID=1641860 RepID=UPI00131DE0FB|nr:helix-turn-helix domain-containing protein [Burkholderia sp. S171]